MTNEQLKAKYPHSNHGPKSDCKQCNGKGEKVVTLSSGEPITVSCICIYVNHDMVDMAQDALNTTISKIRKELT